MKNYIKPQITRIVLDSEISLILSSDNNNCNGHKPDCPCNNCNPDKHDNNNNNPY